MSGAASSAVSDSQQYAPSAPSAKVRSGAPLRAVSDNAAPAESNYLDAWLDWQCKMIAGVLRGAVFRVSKNQLSASYACFPADKQDELLQEQSTSRQLALDTLKTGKPRCDQRIRLDELDGQQADCICLPINLSGLSFIVCLCLAPRSKSQLAAVQQLLQWGGVWLATLERESSSASGGARSESLVREILSGGDLYTACVTVSNRLCNEFECERVSVGISERLNVKMTAISQLADVDRKQQLIRSMEAAMSESADQEKALAWPGEEIEGVDRLSAHQQLCRDNGQLAICTVPLQSERGTVGVVLLERELDRPFSSSELKSCQRIVNECSSAIALRADAERGVLARSLGKITSGAETILSPSSNRNRWQLAVAMLCLIGILFFPVTHRVSARASIEGADKQLLVAPQGGYIKSAHFRAGDLVNKGDVLATLDDRDLLIDQNKWRGELNKVDTSFSQALTSRDRSSIGLLQAKKQQVTAELELIEQKIARTSVTAPFSGVLVSGDLNQSLGAPVEIGQTLFEIASLEDFRLLLSVAEEDVAGIKSGQKSKVRLSSMPGQIFTATIAELIPVSVQDDGANVFRVQAAIETGQSELRPGMQGIAKISTEKDPLIWILLHPLIDKVRLFFWSAWF